MRDTTTILIYICINENYFFHLKFKEELVYTLKSLPKAANSGIEESNFSYASIADTTGPLVGPAGPVGFFPVAFFSARG